MANIKLQKQISSFAKKKGGADKTPTTDSEKKKGDGKGEGKGDGKGGTCSGAAECRKQIRSRRSK